MKLSLFVLFLLFQHYTSGSNDGKVTIVSHHKSGTVLMWNLVASHPYCCPTHESLNMILQMEDFYPFFRAKCDEMCPIEFHSNGAPQKLFRIETPQAKVLHFCRSLPNMLVSAYLYHKACPEVIHLWYYLQNKLSLLSATQSTTQAWTRRKRFDRRRVPEETGESIKAQNATSFCNLLNILGTREGISLELNRSLLANDGIAKMLRDFYLLRKSQHEVLTVCLDDLNIDSWSSILNYIGLNVSDWRPFPKSVIENHATRQHSPAMERKMLIELAAASIDQAETRYKYKKRNTGSNPNEHRTPGLHIPRDFPCLPRIVDERRVY